MQETKLRDNVIDLLRGHSILLVLIHHYHLTYRIDQSPLAQLLPATFLKRLGGNGNYGVIIFFVISGYLITTTTQARHGALKNLSLKSFYKNRAARIIPNLALMVTTVALLAWTGLKVFQNNPGTQATFAETILSIATFTHNLHMQKHGWYNYCLNTLWSLSVEEVFYLGFPLLCLTLKNQKLLIASWAAFIIAAPIYRARNLQNDIVALHAYLSCFDAIAMGCVAAVVTKYIKLSNLTRRLTITAASATIVSVYFYKGILANAVYGISLTALATAIILIAKPPNKTSAPTNRATQLIAWFGKNSYELYLFHIVILALMRTAVPKSALNEYTGPLWFAAYMAASAITAELIAKHYAEPLNRTLRRRLTNHNAAHTIAMDSSTT